MNGSGQVRIIGSRPSSISQGHDLLAYHLARSGWKVSGWRGSFQQQLVARLVRRLRLFDGLSHAQVYHIVLANWLNRRPRARSGLVHLVWGDHLIEFIDQPGRCILTLHQPLEFWPESRWKNIGQCAGIVCMAERECGEIRRRFPHLPCVFIPHGVDTRFWCSLPAPPRRQICAVGRHLRNFEMLFRVARVLLDRDPGLEFLWVVNPDYQLPAALAPLVPAGRFKILRNLSAAELHRLYAESWLFCMPYDNVAASNAIVESMASGTPIFTTRVGGMTSYAGGGVITLVENNDDAALIDAVSRCLASPERRAELGARGRAHAVSHYNWSVVVTAHEAFYRQVLRARARPGAGLPQTGSGESVAEFGGREN